MKPGILICALLIGLPTLSRSQERIHIDASCTYDGELSESDIYGFKSDQAAQAALDLIMRHTGLSVNFTIKAANVPNAVAVMDGNNRIILYNQLFMQEIRQQTSSNLAAVSILAHEVAHHLHFHTLDRSGSRPNKELEADKWSGFILFKMGATLAEARAAIEEINPQGSNTHPPKSARLAAVTNGWMDARDLVRGSDTPLEPEPSSDPDPGPAPASARFRYNHYAISNLLSERIRKFQAAGELVKDVEMLSNSNWVVLSAFNHYWHLGIGEDMKAKLDMAYDKGEEIKQVEVGRNGEWIVLRGLNGYSYHNIPQGMLDKLDEYNRAGKEIRQAELGWDGSWILLLAGNGYWYYGIPQAMIDKLDEYYEKDIPIKQVELGKNGSWIILSGYNGYWQYNIPTAMRDQLESLNQQNKEIKRVCLGDGTWIVLY